MANNFYYARIDRAIQKTTLYSDNLARGRAYEKLAERFEAIVGRSIQRNSVLYDNHTTFYRRNGFKVFNPYKKSIERAVENHMVIQTMIEASAELRAEARKLIPSVG